MKQLHDIQLQILKKLLFAPVVRYSDLKPDKKIENNKFQFHLDTMVKEEYVEKTEDGYILTKKGKEYAGRIDTEGATKIIRQAKIGAFVFPIKTTDEGATEVLIHTRLKQPFYGFQGFMSGKIGYGESIVEGARREFNEETGLDAEVEVVAIRHYLVIDAKTDEIVEDKIIFWCRALNPTGELITHQEGDFYWVNVDELTTRVTKPFETIEVLVHQVDTCINFDGTVTFKEIEHKTESF